jgi:hypothetical protein
MQRKTAASKLTLINEAFSTLMQKAVFFCVGKFLFKGAYCTTNDATIWFA